MKRVLFIIPALIISAFCMAATGPAAPADLRLELSGANINLYWPASATVSAATGGYNIYRSTNAALTDAQWAAFYQYAAVPAGNTATTEYAYADTIADTTQSYFYRVGAYDVNSLAGPLGITASAYPYPVSITGITAYNSLVGLSWAQSTDSAVTGYNIYRSTTPDILTSSLITVLPVPVSQFYDNSAVNLVTYYYRIGSQFNWAGMCSTAVAVTPFAPPFAPSSVTASASGMVVNLTWVTSTARGSYNISGYIVLRDSNQVAYTPLTAYADTVPAFGATYNYSIQTVDANSNTSPAVYLNIYIPGPPSVPSGLTATTGANTVNLLWASNTAQENILSYDVYRNSVLLMNVIGENYYSDTSVSTGQIYSYSVDAQNVSGTSTQSNPINVTVLPAAPVNLTAVAAPYATPGTVNILWTPGDTSSQFDIFRAVSPTAFNFLLPYLSDVTFTSYEDTPAIPGLTYNYCVSAYSGGITGPASVSVSAVPELYPESVSPVNGEAFNSSVLLSWQPAASGYNVSGYHVYSSNDSVAYSLVTSTATTDTYYSIQGLTNGHIYSFKVTTLNNYGESTTFNAYAVSVTPAAGNSPLKVSGLNVASPGDGTISLTWDEAIAGTGVTGYNVYRSTVSGSYTYTTPEAVTSGNFYVSSSNTVNVGADYFYVVDAFGAGLTGPVSDEGNTEPFYRPYPVNNLNGATVNDHISLYWTKPDSQGTYQSSYKYRIYRTITSVSVFSDATFTLLQDDVTATSYADWNVNTTAGVYYYAVKSVDDLLNEDLSAAAPLSVQFGPQQAGPPTVVATAGSAQVILTWNIVGTTAKYFNIYRSNVPGVYGEPIAYNVAFSQKNYTDTGLTNSTTYYYIIKAVNSMGEGPASMEVSAIPYSPVTLAPGSSISLSQVNKKDIYIQWTPATNGTFNVSYYNVLRSNDDGGTYVQIASVTASASAPTDVTDTTTSWDNTYLYMIKAQDAAGNQDAVYTPASITIPLPENRVRVYRNLLNLAANETLKLRYFIVESGRLKIRIYTLSGGFVKELINTQITDNLSSDNPLESQDFYWDGTNQWGKKVAAGLYLISLQIGQDRAIEKIAVVR